MIPELFGEAVDWALAAPRKSPQRWILLGAILTIGFVIVAVAVFNSN
jgi:hypothetical protein